MATNHFLGQDLNRPYHSDSEWPSSMSTYSSAVPILDNSKRKKKSPIITRPLGYKFSRCAKQSSLALPISSAANDDILPTHANFSETSHQNKIVTAEIPKTGGDAQTNDSSPPSTVESGQKKHPFSKGRLLQWTYQHLYSIFKKGQEFRFRKLRLKRNQKGVKCYKCGETSGKLGENDTFRRTILVCDRVGRQETLRYAVASFDTQCEANIMSLEFLEQLNATPQITNDVLDVDALGRHPYTCNEIVTLRWSGVDEEKCRPLGQKFYESTFYISKIPNEHYDILIGRNTINEYDLMQMRSLYAPVLRRVLRTISTAQAVAIDIDQKRRIEDNETKKAERDLQRAQATVQQSNSQSSDPQQLSNGQS